ncbi:MAG: hypothetical protein KAH04_07905 [Psychrilyobacter sp.]|nr:hypothetical protein [Psychrilyobacter sp.]
MYIRRNSKADRNLDYFLSLKSEKDDFLWKFTLSYKFGDKLNIRTTTDSDKYNNITTGVEARTTVNLGAPKGEKIYYSNYTGNSNVYGKVFLDTNNNGVMDADEEGMSNFVIQLNSKDWKSNKDGSFYMSLLSSNSHHTLNIRSENMDLLNYEYQKIYKLRSLPGGNLRLDIPIIPLKSVVGILEFDEDMYIEDIRKFIEDTKIKIKGINSKIEVEIKITDEYFIRDLPIGDYSIEFISQDDKTLKSKIYNFNVPVDDLDSEKYLDIRIKLEGNKFKVEFSE